MLRKGSIEPVHSELINLLWAVFFPEERFLWNEEWPSTFGSESVNSVSSVQDDYSKGHPSGPRPRVLDSHLGPQGCLLVLSDSRIIS